MWIVLALSLIGFLLIYFEFFLPGSLMAILGALALVAGVILFTFQKTGFLYNFLYFAGTILGTIIVCRLAIWQIGKSRKNFSLHLDQEGFAAATIDSKLLGRLGKAETDLKPSGHIIIDEERYQAISENKYINKGTQIVVVDGKGSYFIVKKMET